MAEGFRKGAWVLPQFLPQFCQEKAPRDDPRGFFRAFSLALVEPGFKAEADQEDHARGETVGKKNKAPTRVAQGLYAA